MNSTPGAWFISRVRSAASLKRDVEALFTQMVAGQAVARARAAGDEPMVSWWERGVCGRVQTWERVRREA